MRYLVALVATLALLSGAPATVMASPSGTSTLTLNGTSRTVSSSLADRVRAGKVGGLTASELSQLGIRPGVGSPRPTIVAATRTMVHPDSASGCTGWFTQVCMQVHGSGLYIDHWNTQWQTPWTGCTYAVYWWGNFMDYTTSEDACGRGPFYSWWSVYSYFPAGKACNSWLGSSLEPCITVKA